MSGEKEKAQEPEDHGDDTPRGSSLGSFVPLCYFSSYYQKAGELLIPLLLGVVSVTLAICRLPGLFCVPTGCYLVSLLLECLWLLFHYVESGKSQTGACEAVTKLGPSPRCLW